jgi:site-specific recombinase XerC
MRHGRPSSNLDMPAGQGGMSAEQIQRLLAVVPDTRTGLRDPAIILALTFTGRRRAEVMGLKAGNLMLDGDTIQCTYRGKGGKTGKRELPGPAYEAIVRALGAWGQSLETMAPDESLSLCVELAGPHQRHLLRQPPPLPEARRPSAHRRARLPALGGEAPA